MRERAVRMVFDHQGEYPSQWKAIESIAAKLSINHETLRIWVRRAETDAGERPGLTTDERAQIHELQKEGLLPLSWVMRQWPRAVEEQCQLCPA
jgi:transposase